MPARAVGRAAPLPIVALLATLLLSVPNAWAGWAPSMLDAGDDPSRSELRFGGEAGRHGGAFLFSWNADGLTVPAVYLGASGEESSLLLGGGLHRAWLKSERSEARFRIAADLRIALDGGMAFRVLPGVSWRFALDPGGRVDFSLGIDGRLGGGFGVLEPMNMQLGLPLGIEFRFSDWGQLALRARPAVESRGPGQSASSRLEASVALIGFAPLLP